MARSGVGTEHKEVIRETRDAHLMGDSFVSIIRNVRTETTLRTPRYISAACFFMMTSFIRIPSRPVRSSCASPTLKPVARMTTSIGYSWPLCVVGGVECPSSAEKEREKRYPLIYRHWLQMTLTWALGCQWLLVWHYLDVKISGSL